MELVIDFCTDCGHIDKATEAAREILREHANHFESAELVPAENGVFRISIDSEVVFDIGEEDFSVTKITEDVEKHLEENE